MNRVDFPPSHVTMSKDLMINTSLRASKSAAGAFMNFLTGFLLLALLYSSAQGFRSPAVAGVAPEFQAVNGTILEEGDVFWSINGERVYLYSDVDLLLSLSRGQDLDLVVLRNGEKVTLNGLQWSTFTDMA